MSTFIVLAALHAILYLLIEVGCRDLPPQRGVSWFTVQHEMHGTSKKALGRIQQRKKRR